MDKDQTSTQPDENSELPYTFSDEKTKKKIKQHLSDINDIITDNDIKEVKVPGSENPEKTLRGKKKPAPATDPENNTSKKPTLDDGAEGNPVTPWDVLNE